MKSNYPRQYLIVNSLAIGIVIIGIVLGLLFSPQLEQPKQFMGIGGAATSALQINKEELDSVIELVNTKVMNMNQQASKYQLAGNILKWIGLSAGALITIFAAFSGQIASPSEAMGSIDETKVNTKLIKVIAVLAAINTVTIGLQSPLNEAKTELVSSSNSLMEKSIEIRTKLLETDDSQRQQILLDKLSFEVNRL